MPAAQGMPVNENIPGLNSFFYGKVIPGRFGICINLGLGREISLTLALAPVGDQQYRESQIFKPPGVVDIGTHILSAAVQVDHIPFCWMIRRNPPAMHAFYIAILI